MSVKFTIPADAKQETAGSLSSLTTTEKGSLVGAVNELNSKLTSYITEEVKYADSTTINANDVKALTINVTKQGYIPFGIIGYNSFDASVCLVSAYINDATSIGVTIRNVASSAKTGAYGIRVAYKKA